MGSDNFMLRQRETQWFGRALIEQYAHSGRGKRAACGMIEHRTNLFKADTRKPIDELRHQRSVFKILKKRGDRHASAAEYPGSADALRVAFNHGARGPIDHGKNSTTTAPRRLTSSLELTSALFPLYDVHVLVMFIIIPVE